MNKLVSFLLGAMLLASCSTTFVEPERAFIDLSGQWQSSLGECHLPGTTDENKLGTGDHPVDKTTELTRLYPYEDVVTYSREIEIPAEFEGKRLTLIMERTKPSTLWVDGDSIGHFGHLYAPHEYKLPSLSAGTHKIEIKIDNGPTSVPNGVKGSHAWTDATQTNWNGILGKFGIEATPQEFYIQNVQVYPNIAESKAEVHLSVYASEACEVSLSLEGISWNSSEAVQHIGIAPQTLALKEGLQTLNYDVSIEKPLLWSEFHPALYKLAAKLEMGEISDSRVVDFGMREFGTQPYIATQDAGEFVHVGDTIGSLFTINGLRTFLRGKHDACVFPLTGYAPMDVESWQKVFKVAKSYGINHYRCHSYTPPRAALLAADIEGIYFEIELPYWGLMSTEQTEMNDFMLREGEMTLDFMGNSPSFMMLGLGNELSGDYEEMRLMVDALRAKDNRHLYNFGANDNLGWRGPQDGEDCFLTCRVGGYAPNAPAQLQEKFSSHVRSSFSFADADDGGIINGVRPNTKLNYTHAVRLCPRPVVSHETCQFQIYPDYDEIQKYTGVLYPYNFEVFRSRLEENGLSDQAKDFHNVTDAWSMDCYKADIEYVLRTPGMAGYELLDLQDYPGQGSALCGVLDAFMDSKGVITPEWYCQFSAPVVPLALMDSLCFNFGQPINIGIGISNFLETDFAESVSWYIDGPEVSLSGSIDPQVVANGEMRVVGDINVGAELGPLTNSTQLSLTLVTGAYTNTYRFWVYVKEDIVCENILVASALDNNVKATLAEGGTVLLMPDLKSIEQNSIEGMLTPDYWNYAMFKSISENNNRPVSPGTLGLLFDPENTLFDRFPSLGRSDWQWWSIVRNSRALILNTLPKNYRPLVHVVDNVERNHKLGLLVDLKVGDGKILICPTNLEAIVNTPEGEAYKEAVMAFAASEEFAPQTEVSIEDIEILLNTSDVARAIEGVKNISDYKQQK